MKKEIVLNWGVGFLQIKTMKKVTHHVTNIHVDSMSSMLYVIIEQGTKIERIQISMNEAENIGFINFDALKKFIK